MTPKSAYQIFVITPTFRNVQQYVLRCFRTTTTTIGPCSLIKLGSWTIARHFFSLSFASITASSNVWMCFFSNCVCITCRYVLFGLPLDFSYVWLKYTRWKINYKEVRRTQEVRCSEPLINCPMFQSSPDVSSVCGMNATKILKTEHLYSFYIGVTTNLHNVLFDVCHCLHYNIGMEWLENL